MNSKEYYDIVQAQLEENYKNNPKKPSTEEFINYNKKVFTVTAVLTFTIVVLNVCIFKNYLFILNIII